MFVGSLSLNTMEIQKSTFRQRPKDENYRFMPGLVAFDRYGRQLVKPFIKNQPYTFHPLGR